MDYEYALKYPARGDWVPRIAIGGGLLLTAGFLYVLGWVTVWIGVGVLVLLGALLARIAVDGYVVGVLRRTTHGDLQPPEFDDPEALVRDGLRALGINLAYLSPVIVAGVAMYGVAFAALFAFPESGVGDVAFFLASYVGGPLLGLGTIVIAYFRTAALANFAYEDDLRAAFDFEALREITISKKWAIAWFVAWAVTLAGNFLSLGGFGYLLLFGFFVDFYVRTVAFYVYGRAVAERKGEAPGDPVEAGRPRGPEWESLQDARSTGDDGSMRDDW